MYICFFEWLSCKTRYKVLQLQTQTIFNTFLYYAEHCIHCFVLFKKVWIWTNVKFVSSCFPFSFFFLMSMVEFTMHLLFVAFEFASDLCIFSKVCKTWGIQLVSVGRWPIGLQLATMYSKNVIYSHRGEKKPHLRSWNLNFNSSFFKKNKTQTIIKHSLIITKLTITLITDKYSINCCSSNGQIPYLCLRIALV